ncbi:MAG TPA: transporter substrate-binding domain-containing protein [Desulfobacterales bacterium]|nr:transporter substrate-binding domain-containing protein [Desulfobacterales bacterium]HIP38073.1 transporter substrate-binding domain-containing protein [Desulfocapsa sulfexigens]
MKTFLLLVASLVIFSLSASNSFASGTFIVSGNPKAPPVVWEQYDKLTGVGPDLAKSILTELKLDYDIKVSGDWQQVQDKCKNGEIDMVVSAYKNDERAKYMDFSLPYLPQPTVIVVEKGKEFLFGRWESLIGKKGASNIGESYGQEFDTFIKEKLDVQFVAFERAVELLNRGEADYLIVDLYTALIYARLLRGEDSITILEPPVTTQTFHLTIGKNSPMAVQMPAINKKLSRLVKDGTVEKLFYKHFESWKELIAKRSKYFAKDSNIRDKEYEDYLKSRDVYERERIGSLLMRSREGLPLSAE